MEIKTFTLGVCAANSYVVSDKQGECVIFDPADLGEQLFSYTESANLHLKAVIITHAHFDHIYGLSSLMSAAKNAGVKDIPIVYIHTSDAPYLTDTSLNLSKTLFMCPYTYDGKVTTVTDKDTITVGDMCFEVMHTPGHTPGSSCFIEKNERVIFTGDTIFKASYGRTDFPGGNALEMKNSLERLKKLDGDYTLYPGHNSPTLLSDERGYEHKIL